RSARRAIRWSRGWELLPFVGGMIWLLIAFYPIFYMLITSLRTQEDFFQAISWLPSAHPTLENYFNVLQSGFGTYFSNSVFITVVSVLLTLVVSVPAAYAISRIPHFVSRGFFRVILMGLAIPLQATIIPIYVLVGYLHLY